jgi:hypothetical protein
VTGCRQLVLRKLTRGVMHADQVCDQPVVFGGHAAQHISDNDEVHNLCEREKGKNRGSVRLFWWLQGVQQRVASGPALVVMLLAPHSCLHCG